jgi:hypothetical protein
MQQSTPTTLIKPLVFAAAFLLAPLAHAELEIQGGGANSIQARFEAFSACSRTNDAGTGEVEASCDDEAQALREMIGPRYVSADDSTGGEAQDINASMKETVSE